jgi:hypothetical protein
VRTPLGGSQPESHEVPSLINGGSDRYLYTTAYSGGEWEHTSTASDLIQMEDDDYLEIKCYQATNSAFSGVVFPWNMSWISINEI